VVDVLRDRIMSGEVPVGGRLRQVEISAELGVSTTPVREAFRSLAADGLVQIDEHRGVVVRKLSIAECIEMQELIAVVEGDNLRHAVPLMDRATIDRAVEISDEMSRTHAASRRILLNRDFHLVLAAASGRHRAIALLRELLNLSALHVRDDTDRIPGRRPQVQLEHEALISAAREGNGELAAQVAQDHCQPMLALLRRSLTEEIAPVAAESAVER
jgi:DNA-binding GntR family transcriptional regulator